MWIANRRGQQQTNRISIVEECDKINNNGKKSKGFYCETSFQKQKIESYIKEDLGRVRSDQHQKNQSTKVKENEEVVELKTETETSKSIDTPDIPYKEIFQEYCKLNQLNPKVIEKKIDKLFNSIKINDEHQVLSDCMDKNNDIRLLMICSLKISGIIEYYQSKNIKLEHEKEKANNIVSEYQKDKLYFLNKCNSEYCINKNDNAKEADNKTIKVCMLPNFDWVHLECIEEFFNQTRKKYCEVREKQANKESITSVMEEDLDDLNKIFILTEFVLIGRLITNDKCKSLNE